MYIEILLYLVWMFFSKKQLKIFNRQKVLHITLAEDEVLALQKTEVINNKTHDDHQVVSSMFFFFCKTFHNSNVSICSNLLRKFPANKIYWGTYLTLVKICTQSYSHNESFGIFTKFNNLYELVNNTNKNVIRNFWQTNCCW